MNDPKSGLMHQGQEFIVIYPSSSRAQEWRFTDKCSFRSAWLSLFARAGVFQHRIKRNDRWSIEAVEILRFRLFFQYPKRERYRRRTLGGCRRRIYANGNLYWFEEAGSLGRRIQGQVKLGKIGVRQAIQVLNREQIIPFHLAVFLVEEVGNSNRFSILIDRLQ